MGHLSSSNFMYWTRTCCAIAIGVFAAVQCVRLVTDDTNMQSYSVWDTEDVKESFTPYLRRTYRPYLRYTRLISESMLGQLQYTFTRIYRKFGIV